VVRAKCEERKTEPSSSTSQTITVHFRSVSSALRAAMDYPTSTSLPRHSTFTLLIPGKKAEAANRPPTRIDDSG
jgi:hypothetical protein